MKRIREKGPAVENYGNVTVHYTDLNGTLVDKVYGVQPWISHWEYMADTVGQIQSDFNPCYHFHFVQPGEPVKEVAVEVAPTVYEYYQCTTGGFQAVDILGVLADHDFGIGDRIEDFGAKAEDHFLTAIQDKNSLLNFIIEMIELCEGNLNILKRLQKSVAIAEKTFWRIFQKTGNFWVAWNFAWKPTISDIASWLTTMKRAEKRIKWLRKYNHRPVKVHYRESPIDVNGVISVPASWFHHVPGGSPSVLPQPPSMSAEITYEGAIGLTAWAWVQFDIPDAYLFDLELAIGMASLIMQGVYNPAKIIWEAIPFSWLIEWFVNQKAQLLKEKASLAKLIFPDSVILEMGWTIHLKKLMGKSQILCIGPSGDIRYPIGEYFLDIFDRRPGLPSGDPAFRFQMLSIWQSSILAAIGANTKRSTVVRR